jgi:uncharacterized protein (DUF952 family)
VIILHIIKKSEWDNYKSKEFYGENYLETDGFIHCSDIHTVHNVVWMFLDVEEPLVLLCIDTDKVDAEIKWEIGGSTDYPHIYGLLNIDAVISVLPFLKDENNQFILNQEIKEYIK